MKVKIVLKDPPATASERKRRSRAKKLAAMTDEEKELFRQQESIRICYSNCSYLKRNSNATVVSR